MTTRLRRPLAIAAVAIATTILVVTGRGVVGSQQKEIRETPVFTEFREPPDSLDRMVLDTDAVIRGRLLGFARAVTPPTSAQGGPRTANRVQVLEVLHRSNAQAVVAPSTVDILRQTGDFDHGSYIERSYESRFPELRPGHEYLLFRNSSGPLYFFA